MILALNNKCNLTKPEFMQYMQELESIQTNTTMILCPTFLNIGMVPYGHIRLGAQNVSAYEKGAYTGEIAASQLKYFGVQYAIVGHSERREHQKESNEEIHEKIKRLLEQSMTPILCVGETLEERNQNKVEEVLKEELSSATFDLTEEEKRRIIIAYEPIWSIGTGVIPTNEQIEEAIALIKKDFPNNAVLYGGSANEENIDQLKEISSIDGYLVGGLSLKTENLKIFLQKLG